MEDINRLKVVLVEKKRTVKNKGLGTVVKVQQVLGYVRWENFVVAIGRVMGLCKALGISINDHFCEVTKMISLRTLSIGATPKCLKFIIALQKANDGINKFGFVPVSLYKQLFLI